MTLPPTRLSRLVAVVFLGAFLVRFLAFRFYDDHFDHLSIAAQMLGGELPVLDFADLGRPLKYLLSAAVLAIGGPNLLGEALLISTFLAAGTALTFWAATRAANSAVLGGFAALLVLGIFSREYGYPKILLPALGIWLLWRYVETPGPRRLLALSVLTVAAFLIRYDYGFYLALTSGVALAGRRWSDGPAAVARTVGAYGVVGLLLVSPYLMYLGVVGGFDAASGPGLQSLLAAATVSAPPVAPFPPTLVETEPLPLPRASVRWTSGIGAAERAAKEASYGLSFVGRRDGRTWDYELTDHSPENLGALVADPSIEDTAGFSRARRSLDEPRLLRWRRTLGVPRIHVLPDLFSERNTQAILYYLLMLIPTASLLVLFLRRHGTLRSPSRLPRPDLQIGIVAVLSLLLNLFLIRGNVDSRLGEVIVPAAVLAAWLVGQILTGGRAVPRAGTGARPLDPDVPSRTGAWRPLAAIACAGSLVLWVWLYGSAGDRLVRSGLVAGPLGVASALTLQVQRLAADPMDYWAPEDSIEGSRILTRYVRQCVPEEDRVLGIAYMPELYVVAQRRFAGGIGVFTHWVDSGLLQQQAITRLRGQSVPVVIIDESEWADFEEHFPLVVEYLEDRYEQRTRLEFMQGDVFTVLTDAARVPAGIHPELGLPCYRPATSAGPGGR